MQSDAFASMLRAKRNGSEFFTGELMPQRSPKLDAW